MEETTTKERKPAEQIARERADQKRRRERRERVAEQLRFVATNNGGMRFSDDVLRRQMEISALEGNNIQADLIREVLRLRALVSRRSAAWKALRTIAARAEGLQGGGVYKKPFLGFYKALCGLAAFYGDGSPIAEIVAAIRVERAQIRSMRLRQIIGRQRRRENEERKAATSTAAS